MQVIVAIVLLAASLLVSSPDIHAAEKKKDHQDTVKQGEFAATLVVAMGWDAGLPREPKAYNYLAILGGNRSFRIEAEEAYNIRLDSVVERAFPLYGPFTGRCWIGGIATPTTVHLTVFLPIEGEYALAVSSKGDGQVWHLGDKEFKVSTGGSFREVAVGSAFLKAGYHEITMLMPPEGGVDYLKLYAPSLTPIEPVGGWQIDRLLNYGELAEIEAPLLNLEKNLPDDPGEPVRTFAVTDAASLPANVRKTAVDYYGKPASGQWGRADYNGARIEFSFTTAATSLYGLRVRGMGTVLALEIDGKKLSSPAKPYLDWIDLGYVRIPSGKHVLTVEVPPNGGLDQVEMKKKRSTPSDYLAVTGIKADPDALVKRSELDDLLATMTERFTERK